tara:strand:+ start:349 stop:570 length:222 start_codon:yes stop_codon:yes gene_type:complete
MFSQKNWEKDFKLASSIDIKLMEWTIDYEPDFKNPIVIKDGQERIIELSNKNFLLVKSLTKECFMQRPSWKED